MGGHAHRHIADGFPDMDGGGAVRGDGREEFMHEIRVGTAMTAGLKVCTE